MENVLFILGDYPVTQLQAAIGGGVLVGLLLVIILIVSMRANARRAAEAAAQMAEQVRTSFTDQIAERDRRIAELDHQVRVERDRGADLLDVEREKGAELLAQLSALRARFDEQTKQSEENLARFLGARQQMTDEFKAIAGDVLKSHSETFSRQNREQVDTLLKPLNDKIVEFQSGMLTDRATMAEQIRALAASNLQITTEANNLTRALKGNSQTQGAWGEMILSTILERSGLREGEQFITQQSHTGDNGSRVRTDVEVLMPNNDRLVIDSKVSLNAFEAYTSSDEEDRTLHLQAHINSIRTHIKTLGDKSYHRHSGSKMDYVMMFVPIESALATAIQADAGLVEFGMSRGVMLTTPTTLMTVLRTVRNVWDIEKRHQNAEQIAERAGALYEKVVGFLTTMDKVGTNLDRAQQTFADAKNQLASGKGSVVRQVEMLRELGAKSSKPLPSGWDGSAEERQPQLRLVGEEPGDLS
ncbi:DNA recombination protein RmuC [Devosia sp. SL43]|uniref:DNA recombination protein RmuC n=1 Tax=Devosia sp. SL43 TaxID=2806348 RepID=UPI001F4728AB|nr:DNA recombination protein RmuC [Devosia sp. SL43]UJW84898.1 DNA recombination protein RmuC [Devosia sp. SL43]